MKKLILFLSFVFVARPVFAEFMCDDAVKYTATYRINSYTCNSGEFLPANTLGCVTCPNGFTCPGGTFDFNPNYFQGLNIDTVNNIPGTQINNICADNFVGRWAAIYTANQHTCNPGYYMPANTDGCVICPANSYCAGGTYTFNETIPQGIVACAAGLYAPSGMWELAQCGHILHIGENVLYLRATKKTSHALHFDIDHDGIADYFGNMTTANVPMHNGNTHSLRVFKDGIIYSIYDDTITVPE